MDLTNSQVGDLARLMRLETDLQDNWSAKELSEILSHQLAAPLTLDLSAVDPNVSETMQSVSSIPSECPQSFGELLADPAPPLELLQLAKQFAKQCGRDAESGLPRDVAAVLYLAAVSSALLRCGEQITETDRESLKAKLDWALSQQWVEESVHSLFEQTRELLHSVRYK